MTEKRRPPSAIASTDVTPTLEGEVKEQYIQELFDSISLHYDRMNLIMTAGLWKYWQRVFRRHLGLQTGQFALDVCCGTADLSLIMADLVAPGGHVEGIDLSPGMVAVGREKVARYRQGKYRDMVHLRVGNALDLPYENDRFHCAATGFAMRNVSDVRLALSEMTRVVRPGGTVVCMELSHPTSTWLARPYHLYFDHVVPLLGRWAERRASQNDKNGNNFPSPYAWLPESLRRFPGQEELAAIFRDVGLERVRYTNLQGGIVSIHVGEKP